MNKLYYDELPPLLKPMKKYSNERALTFENPTNDEIEKQKESRIEKKFTIATASETRSGTFHNIHVSELAFFPNAEKTMTALLQCVLMNKNTMVVLESTANGVGGYFYDMWQNAVKGLNDFIPIFLPWFTDPLYKEFESNEKKKSSLKR